MSPGGSRLASRHRRMLVIVLGAVIALALSGIGIQSAAASTRSRLAVSLSPDRSNAVRLDGLTVKGKIYIFVRNSKSLDKVDFYLDSRRRTKPPVRTETDPPMTSRVLLPMAQRCRTTPRSSLMDRTASGLS